MIAIIDYGMGNLRSIQNMFGRIGVQSFITSTNEDVANATKLVLPGVGAFGKAMERIKQMDVISVLKDRVLDSKIPILGICLGMQLLSKCSQEGGKHPGLGFIDAETVRFDFSTHATELKLPHMGWNEIECRRSSPLTNNLEDASRFYFVHSYHVRCHDEEDIVATARYGIDFISIIQHGNIFGVQFHPEKSHKFGMKLLENFVNIAEGD